MEPPGIGAGFLQQLDQARMAPMLASDAQSAEQPTLLDQAHQQYPVLKDLGLQYKKSPTDPNGNMLEFWPPGEPGSPDRPRPPEFDIKKPGVEVYSDKVRPIDILGDVVSHHLTEKDPTISKVYSAFEQSITPQQEQMLAQQYEHAKKNEGEKRPFEEWKDKTGIPAFFRGHPFQQWPAEFNQQVYTPQQMQLLDRMMNYLQRK
jgi:hypothetical protein